MLKERVLRAAVLFAMAALAACSSGGGDTPALDTQAPTILSTNPTDGAQAVPLGATISVTFSEAVAASSVGPSSFQVLRAGTALGGTIVVSGSTATFTPAAALAGDSHHTVIVTTDVKDAAGNALAQDFTFTFRTLDNVAPTVLSTAPATGETGVAVDARVTVTFSEAVDPATVTDTSLVVDGVAGAVAVDGAVATLTPGAPLDPDTLYTARVTTAVQDQAGNALAAGRVWNFTTIDTQPPQIVSRTPAPGATGVLANAVVTVTFSEPIEPATVTSTSFAINGREGTVTVSGSTATLTPSAPLAANTTYTVTVSTDVTDLAGNALAAPAAWEFRTVDTVPPTVASITPAANAINVDTATQIKAAFSEDIAVGSVTVSTFKVTPVGQTTPIAGNLTVAGPEVTFEPAAQLTKSVEYQVTITTGVTDLSGNALASNYLWTFRTVDNHTPVASAGTDQNASFAQVVTLDGSGSYDPDGDPITYQWTAPAGVTLSSTTAVSPTFTAPSVVQTLTFSLRVKDPQNYLSLTKYVTVRVWVDKTKVVLVSGTSGNDANGGGFGAPVKTIAKGIALAAPKGTGAGVYVQAGTYAEPLSVSAAMGIYGGFDSAWNRTYARSGTVINGGATAVQLRASNTRLDRLTINASSASTPGGSSTAVLVANATGVNVNDCAIRAGSGFAGSAGTTYLQTAGGASGTYGTSGECNNDSYSERGIGGAPGTTQVPGGRGGDGGYQGSSWVWGKNGSAGSYVTGGGSSGGGGAGGNSSEESGGAGYSGGAGAVGATGTAGAAFGTIGSGGYTAADIGGTGGNGARGGGGGGGGGSAGQTGDWVVDGAGNGGGGGGGGGYGGYGGTGGRGGGGSFGVLVYSSSVTVAGSSITSATGGTGGNGGSGGLGGYGGAGGLENGWCSSEIGRGGRGGRGGDGGRGGPGGGGSGGPSIGIVRNSTSTLTSTGNSFSLPLSAASGGTPNGVAGARETVSVR